MFPSSSCRKLEYIIEQLLMCLEELDHCLCSLAAAVESLSIYRTVINVFGGAGSLFMFPSSSCRKLEYI